MNPGPAPDTPSAAARGDTGQPSARRRRRWFALALGATLSALIAAGAVTLWNRAHLPERVAAALPAVPNLNGKPAELQERIRRAQQSALQRASALDGVAELGRLYQANGYLTEAEACWRLLLAEQPRNARWSYYLADLRRMASDHAGMLKFLTRTTELAPTYAPAWLRLGDLQFKSGHVADAERAYRKRLALVPGDPYARLGLARIALQQGRRPEARRQLEQLVKDVPGFSVGHNVYAELLAAEGDQAGATRERVLGNEKGRFREAADPWLDELINECFDYDQLCVTGAKDALTNYGDRGKSLFERAIRIRPDALSAYELLGNLYLDLNQPAKARETYELGLRRARDERPTARIYVNLGRAYNQLQQPAEAVRVIEEGLKRAGKDTELYEALGATLGALGEHEAAIDAMRAAVTQSGGDANSYYQLATALLAVHRLDEAVDALHRSLAAQPTFPATLALLAQIEIDSGRWQNAVRYLQPIYDSHPELPEAREKMAYCRLRAGMEAQKKQDFTGAEENYRAGLAINRDDIQLQARLGVLYLIQHRFAAAIEPLEAFHRLQPDSPESALFLGEAYAAVGRRNDARRLLVRGAQLADRAGNATTAQHCREILKQLPSP